MPITLVVNNIPYEYPIPGDAPGWGEGATDWAEQVTIVLNNLNGPDDITQTTFPISNNVTSPANVNGLIFNTGTVRSAVINYSIYITSAAFPFGNSESGVINITYDNGAPSGSKWSLIQYGVNGNTGVVFSVTDSGQVQYTSTNLASGVTFTTSPANATAGAVYSNNSQTFRVVNTIVGGTSLVTQNSGSPSAGPGTLTLVSGTGDATISYSTFSNTTGSYNGVIHFRAVTLSQ